MLIFLYGALPREIHLPAEGCSNDNEVPLPEYVRTIVNEKWETSALAEGGWDGGPSASFSDSSKHRR